MLKGVIHAHSTYSDGDLTLSELRETFMRDGCDFLFVTDHAESLDDEERSRYFEECAALSDDRFVLVPGLEYSCRRRMHILGLGVTFPAAGDDLDPERVITRIQEEGGVAVIAHPGSKHFSWIETFERFPDGIEVWNTKYDGRFAPRTATFDLVRRLRERSCVTAFYGLDLHWRHQYRRLYTYIEAGRHTPGHLLEALRDGRYYAATNGDRLVLPVDGNIDRRTSRRFRRRNVIHSRAKRVITFTKGLLNRTGVRVPGWLKTQLRRFF